MSELPIIKVFDVDYSFIIKNYLNPELWNKTWTLFQYKDMKVTLNIYSIYTRQNKIMFEIRTHWPDNGEWHCSEYDITCSLKIEDITFLKRQINSAIFNSFVDVERNRYIFRTDEYMELVQIKRQEHNTLEQIASDFLDRNEITNESIRDAYIDAYINEYETMSDKISNYVSSRAYMEMPDMYLVFLSCLEDDPKTKIRTEEIKEKLTDTEFKDIMEEVKEFQEYMETDQYKEEMEEQLEEV